MYKRENVNNVVTVQHQCHLVKITTNNKDCVYILRKGCDNQRKIKIYHVQKNYINCQVRL